MGPVIAGSKNHGYPHEAIPVTPSEPEKGGKENLGEAEPLPLGASSRKRWGAPLRKDLLRRGGDGRERSRPAAPKAVALDSSVGKASEGVPRELSGRFNLSVSVPKIS